MTVDDDGHSTVTRRSAAGGVESIARFAR